MKIKSMTVAQIKKLEQLNGYFILRHHDGRRVAFNSKFVPIYSKHIKKANNHVTCWISFRQCSFNEYINLKNGFNIWP